MLMLKMMFAQKCERVNGPRVASAQKCERVGGPDGGWPKDGVVPQPVGIGVPTADNPRIRGDVGPARIPSKLFEALGPGTHGGVNL